MAYITAQNAFPAKIHFAQLWLADECIILYSAEFVKGGDANPLTATPIRIELNHHVSHLTYTQL